MTEEYTMPADFASEIDAGKEFAAGADLFFAIQTDTHLDFDNSSGKNWSDDDSCRNLRAYAGAVGLDFYANLGDITEGYPNDTTPDMRADLDEAMRRYCTGAPCPFLAALGNHDAASMWGREHGNEIMMLPELFDRVMKPMRSTSPLFLFPGDVSYYTIDLCGFRMIVLNTKDSDDPWSNFAIGEEQKTWFRSVALDTTLPVLILAHAGFLHDISSNVPFGAEDILAAVSDFRRKGGTVVGFFYGHEHVQKEVVADGIAHIDFASGASRAELVTISLAERKIRTRMVGRVYSSHRSREFDF